MRAFEELMTAVGVAVLVAGAIVIADRAGEVFEAHAQSVTGYKAPDPKEIAAADDVARAMLPAFEAEQSKALAKMVADREKTLKTWSMKTTRFGDYLALYVTEGDGTERVYAVPLRGESIMLSVGVDPTMSAPSSFWLYGHKVDDHGKETAELDVRAPTNDFDYSSIGIVCCKAYDDANHGNGKLDVAAPIAQGGRDDVVSFADVDPPMRSSDSVSGYGTFPATQNGILMGSRSTFGGASGNALDLRVPHGKGRRAFDAIMAEIARGAPRGAPNVTAVAPAVGKKD